MDRREEIMVPFLKGCAVLARRGDLTRLPAVNHRKWKKERKRRTKKQE